MKPQHHPEKFDNLVAGNEVENTTIHAAHAFAGILDRLMIPHGPIVAGAPGSGAEIDINEMVNEGVSADRPFQLSISVGSQSVNIGSALHRFRIGQDPITALAGDILDFHPGFTPEMLLAVIVKTDQNLSQLVTAAVMALVKPALDFDGGA